MIILPSYYYRATATCFTKTGREPMETLEVTPPEHGILNRRAYYTPHWLGSPVHRRHTVLALPSENFIGPFRTSPSTRLGDTDATPRHCLRGQQFWGTLRQDDEEQP